ncbi:outer membrane lipoprotein-sorting protein [bacterium]|nr:outer membrane lipoprotein-sorting protein [bacterium]
MRFLPILILRLTASIPAGDIPVDEVVELVNYASFHPAPDGRAAVRMTIRDGQGREQTRELVILRRDRPLPPNSPSGTFPDQDYFLLFSRPTDYKGMAFLVRKRQEGDDDRRLYLPALDLVKPIVATDKRTSFAGSHFFYEDISGRNPALDTHTLVASPDPAKFSPAKYLFILNTPKDPSTVEFSSYLMVVHRDSWLPVWVEYRDRQGVPYRLYQALGITTIDDIPTVTRAVMKDLRSGGQTLVRYGRVAFNLGLPADLFTERSLRHPPQAWLR